MGHIILDSMPLNDNDRNIPMCCSFMRFGICLIYITVCIVLLLSIIGIQAGKKEIFDWAEYEIRKWERFKIMLR